jgi:putative transposase
MKKHSKQSLTQNMVLRVLSIRIRSDKLERKLKNILLTYKHFENILLILISKITTYTKKAKIQTTLAC